MAYSTVTVINESGNTGTDYAVFTDTVSGKIIQGVKLIDSTEGSELPIGITGNPLHVTGSITVADVATETTLSDIKDLVTNIDSNITTVDTGAVTITGALPTGANTIGAVNLAQYTPVTGRLPVDGSGVTQPVSGTVTANQGGVWNITNISGTVSLPTGAATAANQTTLIGHVDGIEGLLTSIAAEDFATQTTLAAINTKLVSGTDIGDVTINNAAGASAVNIQDGGNTITVDGTVAATQSGTWNINNVSGTVSLPTGAATAANQSTIIGHVDGIETAIGTTNTNTGNSATSLALLDDTVYSDGASITKFVVVGGADQGTIPFTVKPICVETGSDAPVNTYETVVQARNYRMGLGNQWRRARNQGGQLAVAKTTTGAHTTSNNDGMGAQDYAIQVKGTGGAATAWVVGLEFSLDNTNFTTALTHNTATGDGVVLPLTGFSTRYWRFNVTTLTLGAASNIVITVLVFNKG